jgi:hypothetical protein
VTNTGYNAPTTGYDSSNPYANNPPPPTGTYGEYAGGGFAAPTSPPNTYQPQGQATYNGNTGGEAANYYGTKDTPLSGKDNELADHSYEYTQAQQNAAAAGNPPVYDGYAAPAGPPPGKN